VRGLRMRPFTRASQAHTQPRDSRPFQVPVLSTGTMHAGALEAELVHAARMRDALGLRGSCHMQAQAGEQAGEQRGRAGGACARLEAHCRLLQSRRPGVGGQGAGERARAPRSTAAPSLVRGWCRPWGPRGVLHSPSEPVLSATSRPGTAQPLPAYAVPSSPLVAARCASRAEAALAPRTLPA